MKKRYIEPVISWCYTRIFQSYWSPKTILELSFCLCLNWGINSSWPMSRAQLVPETHSIANIFLSTSGDLGIGLVWHNLSGPHPTHFLVPLLKSSSNWTKFSMRGPQLFSGWYQMILGVFRCSQQFPDVFRLFSDCFLTMFSDCWNPLQAELNYLWWVLSYSQDDIRWF